MATKIKPNKMGVRRPFTSFKFRKGDTGPKGITWYVEGETLQSLVIVEHLVQEKDWEPPVGTFTLSWRGTPDFSTYLDQKFWFASKEDAATFMYQMLSMHRDAVKQVPIPKDIHEQMQRQMRQLRDQERGLRSICFTNRMQQEDLRRLALSMGDTLGIDPKEPISKAEEAIKTIDEITLEGDTVPFFSEAKLYKLLGKQDARTILAVVHNLKRVADPVVGE